MNSQHPLYELMPRGRWAAPQQPGTHKNKNIDPFIGNNIEEEALYALVYALQPSQASIITRKILATYSRDMIRNLDVETLEKMVNKHVL
jgi:hypothetical protein